MIKVLKIYVQVLNQRYYYVGIDKFAMNLLKKVGNELKDKIHFEQDQILWMRFKMNISFRAIPIVLETIERFIPLMEYFTDLYFRKLQLILLENIQTTGGQNKNKKNY